MKIRNLKKEKDLKIEKLEKEKDLKIEKLKKETYNIMLIVAKIMKKSGIAMEKIEKI